MKPVIIPSFSASSVFHTGYTLAQLGTIFSEKLMGGLPFGGEDEHLRDEVPAIFIEHKFLDMFFLLMGNSNTAEDPGFSISFYSRSQIPDHDEFLCNPHGLNGYWYYLIQEALKEIPDLQISPLHEEDPGKAFTRLQGTVTIKSALSLPELGRALSSRLLFGLPFCPVAEGYQRKETVTLQKQVAGLSVKLHLQDEGVYVMDVFSTFVPPGEENAPVVSLDDFLKYVVKTRFEDLMEIEVQE
ncbi:hypothetical protein SAMN05421788_109137 [Filimonas lacunae]|uniref:Uncharacterized protein n=1 Tax=Filimonas lacunae TaxID=477680 RepID=A0A173MJC2_9BACT|nr:hypothetical protein [Filimonas lacunae]BAV07511.1 hypothetical protein FLA_3537 [Filimonas lacunae]SIT30133.1 hypothetical protein SAMN05421788_109137 [Filimonas lacunae]